MKKTISFLLIALSAISAFGAAKKQNPNVIENSDGTITITAVDKDSSVKLNQKYENQKGVTIIDSKKVTKNNPVTFNLADFGDKEIGIEFSCDIKIETAETEELDLSWMINDFEAGMPVIIREIINPNAWVSLKGEKVVAIGQNKSFYLSGSGLPSEYKIYIKNLKFKLSGENISSIKVPPTNWMDAPSLKEAYSDYFDHFGLACTYRGELQRPEIQKGIARHASSITMGNETKPDALFGFTKIKTFKDFVAEDGKTYQMPVEVPNFNTMDICLTLAKKMGVQVRGHVLVWHSQTPELFFRENFSSDAGTPFVDKETINARMEWYIKTVIEHVTKWEEEKNGGQRLVYAWDVVNEAVADGATTSKWLREDSNWFRVYKDDSFIINAFRYATKYAPQDIQLVYNDYGCSNPGKRYGICQIVDKIKATPDARIDAVGMQSHIKINSPVINIEDGNNSFEEAVQTFISHGVNVQITELDVANNKARYSPMNLKERYKQLFQMFIRNRAKDDQKGITSVTIWGLTDRGTWLDKQTEYIGYKQYPLLLNEDYSCKPAFLGVLEAAESVKEE